MVSKFTKFKIEKYRGVFIMNLDNLNQSDKRLRRSYSVHLTLYQDDCIRELVDQQKFMNKSEFIRSAVTDKLKQYNF